jgi:hypothetical protein
MSLNSGELNQVWILFGSAGAGPGLMGFPARPPGLMPAVEAGEDRMRLLDGHLADRAIGTAVDLLDEVSAQGDISEIGVEANSSFHFISPYHLFPVVFLLS